VLIYRNLFGEIENKIDQAIEVIKQYEPPEGYYVAFSGGKDSVIILDLVRRAGVKHDAHLAMTTVDPPEVYQFVREYYPDVIWERPKRSMFQLIVDKGMLPTRVARFCCAALKEIGGKNRLVVTGIRHQEGTRRANREIYEQSLRDKTKWFLNPIITWTTEEVWEYIKINKLPYCRLYDVGYERLGCIMCPLQGTKGMLLDKERFPKYYRAYLRAIERMLKKHPTKWQGNTVEDIMYWWIYGTFPDGSTQTDIQEVLDGSY
jgi:phosphoadenosine phosphosulfate reductase